MFLTALCSHIGVLPRDRVVLGDRGAEFPEGPALDAEVIAGPRLGAEFPERPALGTEVIAGPQPGALGFKADAPDVSGRQQQSDLCSNTVLDGILIKHCFSTSRSLFSKLQSQTLL